MVLESNIVQLAREIAINHLSTAQIQELYKITPEQWQIIQRSPRFQKLLEGEILAWQGATNTAERTKLKAGAMVEEWLPEANKRLHDQNEPLNAKTELAKLVARIAGLESRDAGGPGNGGFSVTINLGDKPRVIDAALPSRVISNGSAE